MNHIKINEKTDIYEFDNILDYVDYANEVPEFYYSKSGASNYWAGGTFEDAVIQGRTGNPDYVKSMFEGVNIISSGVSDNNPGEVRDVTGDYFDVGDFLSGEPEVFRRTELSEQKPVVPVCASFSMHNTIGNESIKNRGCAIVALCDELANNGYLVDLHLVHAVMLVVNGRSSERRKVITKIAVRLDPLDIDTVAFILANPLCMRRLTLAAIERYDNDPHPEGHGRPGDCEARDIFEEGEGGFFFGSSLHREYDESNYMTLESAKKHVQKMIEKFNESPGEVIYG